MTGILAALFAAALVVGMTVRAVRAPRGQRARAAFGPLMGAGETYQELHTGQRGLHDSMIEAIAEQEQRPSRTDADGDGGGTPTG
ncbi:hypothetical protein [Agromyces kandeliae]|uniref:Uncharacterized protein n=1 Tax=Agromyces kandeliae TaxID=2666141 RepID=A0A6L5R216_9MICO|nr:hypothetical protein [Agromyces kandeliae]MRX43057.1 hypothetical protein [Agromyces kandeliae]